MTGNHAMMRAAQSGAAPLYINLYMRTNEDGVVRYHVSNAYNTPEGAEESAKCRQTDNGWLFVKTFKTYPLSTV